MQLLGLDAIVTLVDHTEPASTQMLRTSPPEKAPHDQGSDGQQPVVNKVCCVTIILFVMHTSTYIILHCNGV